MAEQNLPASSCNSQPLMESCNATSNAVAVDGAVGDIIAIEVEVSGKVEGGESKTLTLDSQGQIASTSQGQENCTLSGDLHTNGQGHLSCSNLAQLTTHQECPSTIYVFRQDPNVQSNMVASSTETSTCATTSAMEIAHLGVPDSSVQTTDTDSEPKESLARPGSQNSGSQVLTSANLKTTFSTTGEPQQESGTDKSKKSTERTGNLLWCNDCGKSQVETCPTHGALLAVPDSYVPTFARLTLPPILVIKKGPQGEGVYAKKYIKSRSQFGPLQAPFCKETMQSDKFYLKGYDSDDVMRQFDLSDEDCCNWMMFVKPAEMYAEQNVAAYIYDRHVYFTTIKPIEYGKELRVWYAADYAVQIGMSLFTDIIQDKDNEMEKQEELTAEEPKESADEEKEKFDVENEEDDSEDEFQIADHDSEEDISSDNFSDTFCSSCDTQFKTQRQLANHSCRTRAMTLKRKKKFGATRRKGNPRKLSRTGKGEGKSTVARKRSVSKSQARMKSKKVKIMENGYIQRKKYVRIPKFFCSYCPKQFTAMDPFKAHEATHTGESAYICDHPGCGKGFDTKFTHWRHMLSHNKPLNRQCPYCDKSFSRLDHLKSHLVVHDQQRFTFLCDVCGKSYYHKSSYDYHMAVHNAKEGSSLACPICAAKFPSKEELFEHTLSHNKYKSLVALPKKHQCSNCSRMFSTKKDLRRHMIVHTKEKSYLCELCPQTFGRKDHLSRHYKTNHSEKEPKDSKREKKTIELACEYCDEKFTKKKHLLQHMKTGYHHQDAKTKMDDVHPLVQAAGDLTEASVTSSSYNLYALSTPHMNQNTPISVLPLQAAKSLERYISTSAPGSIASQGTDVSAPVTYISSSSNVPMNIMEQSLENLPDQLHQVKERLTFPTDQLMQRQTRQVPWQLAVIEERDDHSYSAWTQKGQNVRPLGTTGNDIHIEPNHILQPGPLQQGAYTTPNQIPTTMTVSWDTMAEYYVPANNVEVVATCLGQQPNLHQQQQQQQQQIQHITNQNLPQVQKTSDMN